MMLQSTRIDNTLLAERFLALLSGFFAMVAIVLVAVGLYGVLSYTVVRRTKEIGIRVALGAGRIEVVRLIVADIILVIVAGLITGTAGGFALGRFITSLLYGVKPTDFSVIALPILGLLVAMALTAVPSALRAARVDPRIALREE